MVKTRTQSPVVTVVSKLQVERELLNLNSLRKHSSSHDILQAHDLYNSLASAKSSSASSARRGML